MPSERRRHRALALTLFALVLPGCTIIQTTRGGPLPASPEELPAEGGPPLGDVLELLGPPSQVTALDGGFALLYERYAVTEHQIGIGARNISWVKVIGGSARTERETAMLLFDADRRLVGRTFRTTEEGLGLGGGVQLFFQVAGVVDSSSLDDPYGIHDWGRACLDPLPRPLNRDQSLDSGENGFEIIGTPARFGQDTLEEP